MDRIKRMTVPRVCSFAFLFALLSFYTTDASGQAVTATLSGRIADASGGIIAKAGVTVLNAATGFSRSAQTSDAGEYTIPALPAGDYAVTVVFTGFGKQ
ncbi:MAG: carboxypeptidase-like regulatory domain-containing protein, partial [Candidatus Acidiferrum sp.]